MKKAADIFVQCSKTTFNKAAAFSQKKIRHPLAAAFHQTKTVLQSVRLKDHAFYALTMGISIYTVSLWGDNADDTTKVLNQNGVHDIRLTGYQSEPTSCSVLSEPFRVGFTGTDKNSQPVSGVVCKNYLYQKRVTFDAKPTPQK